MPPCVLPGFLSLHPNHLAFLHSDPILGQPEPLETEVIVHANSAMSLLHLFTLLIFPFFLLDNNEHLPEKKKKKVTPQSSQLFQVILELVIVPAGFLDVNHSCNIFERCLEAMFGQRGTKDRNEQRTRALK